MAVKKTADKKAKTVVIPDSVNIKGVDYKVTEISRRAFAGMKKLTNLTIGENITSIGESAFESCQKLQFVSVPKNVRFIEKRAFASCKKLHFFIVQSKVLSGVGSKAFLGTYGAVKVKVPKKKLKAYKVLMKNGKLSRYAVFITPPKMINYKGVDY